MQTPRVLQRRPGVQGVKTSEVFNRLYTVFKGNFVNIWDANGFFPSQGSFQFLPRDFIDS